MPGFKAEVLVEGKWSQNSVVWPDLESAEIAARDLYGRWTMTADHRAVEVDEEPNVSTWDEHTAKHGTPPKRVVL